MRKRGRRLPWREIENGPSFIGTLVSYRIRHGDQDFQAVALQSGSPAEGKPLEDLYEPVLVGFAPNAFVLRGYERLESSEAVVGVVQEWHCKSP